jgi:hypothetical protein
MLQCNTGHHVSVLRTCAAGKRPPILVLGDVVGGDAFFPEFVRRFKEASTHAVVTAASLRGVVNSTRRPKREAAVRAWSRMEMEYGSVCLGMVATTASTIVTACQILTDGWKDGNLPGAVAFLGYTTTIQETVLELSRSFVFGTAVSKTRASDAEWPPTMILLPADDPTLVECASACRRMRSLGVPIQLEIVGASRVAASVGVREVPVGELVGVLDVFFDTNLAPYFPKRI